MYIDISFLGGFIRRCKGSVRDGTQLANHFRGIGSAFATEPTSTWSHWHTGAQPVDNQRAIAAVTEEQRVVESGAAIETNFTNLLIVQHEKIVFFSEQTDILTGVLRFFDK